MTSSKLKNIAGKVSLLLMFCASAALTLYLDQSYEVSDSSTPLVKNTSKPSSITTDNTPNEQVVRKFFDDGSSSETPPSAKSLTTVSAKAGSAKAGVSNSSEKASETTSIVIKTTASNTLVADAEIDADANQTPPNTLSLQSPVPLAGDTLVSENNTKTTINRAAPSLESRFDNATALVREGNLEAAKAEFISLANDYPEIPEILVNLSAIYSAQGDWFIASDILAQALVEHPDHPSLLKNLAIIDEHLSSRPKDHPTVSEQYDQVLFSLDKWKHGWMSGNIVDYLSNYSPIFVPNGGVSLGAWKDGRKMAIKRDSNITVGVSDVNVKLISSRVAEVSFHQTYKTPDKYLATNKKLTFYRDGGGERWYVISENTF